MKTDLEDIEALIEAPYNKENGDDKKSKEDKDSRDRRRDRRSRSRSHDRKHRSSRSKRSRSRSRSRDRDRDRKRRRSSSPRRRTPPRNNRGRDRDREKNKAELDPERARQRELEDLERDKRTIFVYQLSTKVDEKKLADFFTKAGKVRDVRLITDRFTNKSKGFGYIEFASAESIPAALALEGQPLCGFPLKVKYSEAEKNAPVQSAASASVTASLRLFVTGIPKALSESDIREVFEVFGPLDYLNTEKDESFQFKGTAYVKYKKPDDAKKALTELNGQNLGGGEVLRLGLVNENMDNNVSSSMLSSAQAGELDDENGNLMINAQTRVRLMHQLSRGAQNMPGLPALPSPLAVGVGMPNFPSSPMVNQALLALQMKSPGMQLPPGMTAGMPNIVPQVMPTITVPARIVLIKNMFDPATETDPNFDEDLRDDVEDECSKFGPITHIYVDKASQGFVYVMFETIDSAKQAQSSLHGRWFAGKMITCDFIQEPVYKALMAQKGQNV